MKKIMAALAVLLFVNMPLAAAESTANGQLLIIKSELADLKRMIIEINPYRADLLLAKIDRINRQINYAIGEDKQLRRYTDSEVADLASKIKKAWPYRSQKPLILVAAKNAAFNMKQIRVIIDQLDFPNDKKEVLGVLVPNAVDPQNIDLFFDIFWTQPDKDYLYSLVK